MKKILLILLLSFGLFQVQAQGYKRMDKNSEKKQKEIFGKDILAFYPFQVILTNANQTQPDLTVGVSYERIFNNEHLSFKLPVFASIQEQYFYIMPTLKIYPFGQGLVRFAVGPQLLFGYGNGSYNITKYDQVNGYYTQEVSGTKKQFGFMINPSLNVTMSKHFYLTVESSLGIIYYDSMPYDNSTYYNASNTNNPVSPAFQLNFGLGYRF